jgi:Domain of Unknown Function (DUF1080)/Carbohydrate binding module (family 35)
MRRRIRGVALVAGVAALAAAGAMTAVVANAGTGASPAVTTRYEAESGVCQGTIDNNHTGFSGTGFCNLTNAVGSTETWTVNAANTGTATLSFRYSNGTTTNRPMSISVNGGAPVTVNFPSTSVWTTWATATVSGVTLVSGTNTVKATSNTADGGPNLDFLDVDLATGTTTLYEAENGTIFHGTVDSDHAGFTGTGFVNLTNEVGSYLQLNVNAPIGGSATLTFRYSNGTTTNRPADISVNGGTATRVNFPSTSVWTTWANASLTTTLNSGTNTVRLTSVTADGAANIDSLTVVTQGGPPDGNPPTAPGTPTQVSITATSVTVSWAASTDDTGVVAYDLFADGQACGSVAGNVTTGTCSGLTSNADHSITVKARDAAGNISPPSGALPVHTPAGGGPFGDPNLVSMFNGTDLSGWTSSATGLWSVVGGAIHGNGTQRGWIYYNRQVGTFRWIFDVRQVSGDHAPTVLIWGTTNPIRDALSAIQFQPPNGGHWDYRPGHNNGGSGEFTQLPHTKFDIHQWSQCELIGDMSTGVAKMACGQLGNGTTICNAVEVLDFKDPTAGVVGPLAIQVHNSGIHDEYKGLYLESPVVTSPGQFITTHC